ncbi:ribonuclease H-like domain-containing protein [Tanacetum coccineum]
MTQDTNSTPAQNLTDHTSPFNSTIAQTHTNHTPPPAAHSTLTQHHSPSSLGAQHHSPTNLQNEVQHHIVAHQPLNSSPNVDNSDTPLHNKPNPSSVHPMVIRFCVGTNRPLERLNLHVSSVSPLPKSYRDAFNDPNWQNAMRDEYYALIKNQTWTLVPGPTDANIVRCMWNFRHKFLDDGTLSRHKAHLVANGSNQIEGIDVD